MSYYSGISPSATGIVTLSNCSAHKIDVYYWLPVGEGHGKWTRAHMISPNRGHSKTLGSAAVVWYTKHGGPGPTDASLGSSTVINYVPSMGNRTFCISGPTDAPTMCHGCGTGAHKPPNYVSPLAPQTPPSPISSLGPQTPPPSQSMSMWSYIMLAVVALVALLLLYRMM